MWSLTLPRVRRTSGAKKFRSSARKDFFDSIDPLQTFDVELGVAVQALGGVVSTSKRSAIIERGLVMPLPEESTLLRIFIGEADEVDGLPLYEAIVTKARVVHMAGATVLRGPLGFGRSSRLHTEKILRLSQDLPVVIEIVDRDEKIGAFISEVMTLTKSCLITTEKVRIIRYGESN
jgi:PII-like signaling protein